MYNICKKRAKLLRNGFQNGNRRIESYSLHGRQMRFDDRK